MDLGKSDPFGGFASSQLHYKNNVLDAQAIGSSVNFEGVRYSVHGLGDDVFGISINSFATVALKLAHNPGPVDEIQTVITPTGNKL
ncbi:MAG: hypothetical protein AAF732_11060 [Pseudomonadota bacterium]